MKAKEKKPTKKVKEKQPKRINFGLTPFECKCLMDELEGLLRVCNRDNRNALIFWELFAKGLYQKEIKYTDESRRNKILGIDPLKDRVNLPKEESKKEEQPKEQKKKSFLDRFLWR